MPELKYMVESILFVSDSPVTVDQIRSAIPEAEPNRIRAALEQLGREYEMRGGGFTLKQVAGGYQLRTRPEFADTIRRLHRTQPQRLSRAALETLAIIAYKQPVMRAEIEHVRGVDSGGVLRQLLEKDLVRVLGRKEIPGRPMIYATTKRFLEIFELKDLSELPTLKEIEELGFDKPGEDPDAVHTLEEDDEGDPPDTGETGTEGEAGPEEPGAGMPVSGGGDEGELDGGGYSRGSRRGVDLEHGAKRRLAEAWPGADDAGDDDGPESVGDEPGVDDYPPDEDE
ncbi:MAG: SMC-Scp complex subunit ScpB [Desulfatibacillaceae bacterium]